MNVIKRKSLTAVAVMVGSLCLILFVVTAEASNIIFVLGFA